jgi:hypothetical protein
MDEEIDWSLTTWEGSRREQHRRFLALSLSEKIAVVESLGEMAALFEQEIRAGPLPLRDGGPG